MVRVRVQSTSSGPEVALEAIGSSSGLDLIIACARKDFRGDVMRSGY